VNDVVDAELRLPAESAYVSVLRMATAGLAARLDFTVDDIEDLRMAVSEACALVLDGADPGGQLTCGYHLGSGSIRVTVAAPRSGTAGLDTDSVAWQVLNALADDITGESASDHRRISFTLTSETT